MSAARLAAVLLLLVAAGCGGDGDGSARRVDRCADRLLAGAHRAGVPEASSDDATDYVRTTYCERFERNGWIYDDGALSIDVQVWLDSTGSEQCATAEADGSSRTVPCDGLERGPHTLDCAILQHVRRDEVKPYLDRLESRRDVACDDGQPLDQLGAP